jgi:hypothetical protein
VLETYEMQPHHLRLLQLAAESWDSSQMAREAIEQHGQTYVDRFGAPRLRPEVNVERDARLSYARLLRELDLDIEPPSDNGTRPPGLKSNRRFGYAS